MLCDLYQGFGFAFQGFLVLQGIGNLDEFFCIREVKIHFHAVVVEKDTVAPSFHQLNGHYVFQEAGFGVGQEKVKDAIVDKIILALGVALG